MLQVLEGPTIAAGESLSDVIDCTAGQLVRITMPPEWDEAPLTFQISTDGVFFNDLFQLDGYEVAIEDVVPGSAVLIPESIGRAIAFMRFRSGTRRGHVKQDQPRVFAVAIITESLASAR
jgi:hypothetical protein